MEQILPQPLFFLQREQKGALLSAQRQMPVDQVEDLTVRHFPGKVDLAHYAAADLLPDFEV